MQLHLFEQNELPQQLPRPAKKEPLTKTAEMLDENIFWSIVSKSLKYKDNQRKQEAYLIKLIRKLTPKEIIGFRLRTDKLLYDTYSPEMWCAGYIMNNGCSDDGFEYFRNWVISRGKRVYYRAKKNPDTLVALAKKNNKGYDFEGFWYVALAAFERKTGKHLYDYIDYDNFHTREGNYGRIPFDDNKWDENDVRSTRAICPQLFDLLWGYENYF